ncbi:TlpA family protein disulfide reductase [Paenibacillus alginolyticus]|uniref:TlpA disulfide reductase family protein n=1 Tax=Paenibacillus alginolyticus TaxID=59839 RepID=UPI0004201EA7|nr:TlpA disulfide reductase family protein [Paenibacillus alginolyticus]MCY9667536.1 TlpA family protein disulfide reductase [Paenibacillus alginolyticus]
MKKSIFAIIMLLGLVLYGVYDYYGKKTSESSPATEEAGNIQRGIQKGQKAPDFELKDLQGQTVKLSDFQGKKVMINFWATWCPPCRVEMPHMQKFYADYNKQGVVILAVNLTPTEENADSVPAFVKDYGLTFPVVLDEEGTTMQTYQVVAYPTTYLLDSNGVIREKFQGAINYDMMKQAVSKIK